MPNTDKLETILTAQQMQLELTFSASDTTDTKNLAVLAANLAIIIYVLQALLGGHVILVLTVAMLSCYVLSIGCNLAGTWPRNYIGPGVKLKEHPDYYSLAPRAFLLQIIADTNEAIRLNTLSNTRKSKWLTKSLVLSGIGIICMIGCILVI